MKEIDDLEVRLQEWAEQQNNFLGDDVRAILERVSRLRGEIKSLNKLLDEDARSCPACGGMLSSDEFEAGECAHTDCGWRSKACRERDAALSRVPCLYCNEPMHVEEERTWCVNAKCPGSVGNPRVQPKEKTHEQRNQHALKMIEAEIECLTSRPRMFDASLAAAEFHLWDLLGLREILLGKERNPGIQRAWWNMVRDRWPQEKEKPGALGWNLYVLHRQDDKYEPVNHDAWVKDAREIATAIMNR